MVETSVATQRFRPSIDPTRFSDAMGDPQIVFHGINKSGSLAMESTLVEAFNWAGRGSSVLSHYRMGGKDEDFKNRVDAFKGRSGLVVGHYLYGALAPVPNRIWITQFRHPLPRVLSCYQWLKNKHAAAHGSDASYPSLVEFVFKTRGVVHSQVAQFGCGYGPNKDARLKRATASELFDIAVDEIESNVFAVSIAEHFEESIFTYAGLCGLDSVAPWARDNRNKGRPLADEISAEQRQVIEHVYSNDYKLYDYALDRFWRQTRKLGLDSDESLKEYKTACLDQYKDRIVRDSPRSENS